jgi:16S rRNA (adenine1518-N6/adenine1519-N6)-dimethyltransferase
MAGWVVEASNVHEGDTVVEIGPGHGILTRELLKKGARVVAIEKDPSLVAELENTFVREIDTGTLTIYHDDIRDFTPTVSLLSTRYVVVANIPYYITGYILRAFLTTEFQPAHMTVLIQKEVAERIVAKDGKESLLSLSVKAYGNPSLVRVVKAGAFSPPPKVDSAILHIENISRERFSSKAHEERFYELLHAGFASKRKQLGASLGTLVAEDKLVSAGIHKTARPEDVRFSNWITLATLSQF